MQHLPQLAPHALSAPRVLSALETEPTLGLSGEEVARRRQRCGPNVLTARRGKSALVRFLAQLHQPLIYLLIAAALITVALREWVDASVIFGVVILNAIIGFIQESKALQAIEGLARALVSETTVIRGGRPARVAAEELVPGDIVVLAAGDRVPADVRLLSTRDLRVDESALTGESLPVSKDAAPTLPVDTPLADRRNMAYGSTAVTYGQATAVVTATGDDTEVGRISELVSTASQVETPLTRKFRQFSHLLLTGVLALGVLGFVIGVARGEAVFDVFMAAVALMVGAVPEGLPAALTILLALGVSKMARRRAIIRKLPAVETLGSTTLICSDKTGTLTENQMTVLRVTTAGVAYDVEGRGYAPKGGFFIDGARVEPCHHPALIECLKAGLLCNDSRLVEKEGRWEVEGDPTEGALLVAAQKAGLAREALDEELPRIDAIPFQSEYQYMATLHLAREGTPVIYAKGSAEAILARCADRLGDDGGRTALDPTVVQRAAEEMAAEGLRVLAFARRHPPAETRRLDHPAVDGGLTFLGLVGMIDPPREEAKAAIEQCRRAGIGVKMITGDHALTASVIAGQLGLSAVPGNKSPVAMTGKELAALSEQELQVAAEQTSVFARVTPEQKLRLVQALQARGHVVAMTGDGVNDAPALRQADIGIAMGRSGTDVAKDAADMVLTDDNFASIEAAVEEGRGVFDNLTKVIAWTLPTNLGEGFIILASLVLGATLPVLPLQLLWVNMTTVVVLGLTLAFEPREADVMDRPPRRIDEPILTRELILRTLFVGLLIVVVGMSLFELQLWRGVDVAAARTTTVNAIVAMEAFYLFNCRTLVKPVRTVGLWTNPWVFVGVSAMLALQLLLTYAPVMNTLFHTAPIDGAAWALILAAGIALLLLVGLEKRIRAASSG